MKCEGVQNIKQCKITFKTNIFICNANASTSCSVLTNAYLAWRASSDITLSTGDSEVPSSEPNFNRIFVWMKIELIATVLSTVDTKNWRKVKHSTEFSHSTWKNSPELGRVTSWMTLFLKDCTCRNDKYTPHCSRNDLPNVTNCNTKLKSPDFVRGSKKCEWYNTRLKCVTCQYYT